MTNEIDFEKIICGTRTIDQMPFTGKSRRAFGKRMGKYMDIEKEIVNRQLAQSLSEFLARKYWLECLSAGRVSLIFYDYGQPVFDYQIYQMMNELNIPIRTVEESYEFR